MRRERSGFSARTWIIVGVLSLIVFLLLASRHKSSPFKTEDEICISVVAQGRDNHDLRKIPFFKFFLPSFKKTMSPDVKYTLHIGYNEQDPYYRNNAEQVMETAGSELKRFKNVKLEMKPLNSESYVSSWNRLAKIQYEQTQCSYFLSATEDTVLITPNWANVVVADFLKNPWKENFGVIEAKLVSSKQSENTVVPVVHSSHFEIFGYLTPPTFNRLEASKWLSNVYGSFSPPSSFTVTLANGVINKGETISESTYRAEIQKSNDLLVTWLTQQGDSSLASSFTEPEEFPLDEEIEPVGSTDSRQRARNDFERRLKRHQDVMTRYATDPSFKYVKSTEAEIWDLYEPILDCRRERIGAPGDGGKWCCNPEVVAEKKPCTVFSFGVSNDNSFEREWNEVYGCITHSFDATEGVVESMKDKFTNDGMHIHEIGLGPGWGPHFPGFETKTMRELVDELGVTRLDVLKIDIEGSEFAALDFLETEWFKGLGVTQVLLEIHYFKGWNVTPELVIDLFTKFEKAGFYPFSKEPNLLAAPNCIEYSFALADWVIEAS